MPSSNTSWGIEVGAGALKALKLVRDDEEVKVADFVLIPHKRVLTGPDIDRADALRVSLGGFLSQYRDELRGAAVAVSVPGNAAFARFAKLPPVEPKGVAGLVKFEAVQQIPFPIEQVEWDYQTFASADSPEVEVGIFAMTKEKVSETLAIYKDVDLTPDIINLSPVSVYNAIAYDLNFSETTPGTVIIDIGAASTDIIIAESGKVWVRTFPMGGHAFTEAIAAAFKLPYPKAEKLKREIETSKYKKNITQALKPVFADFFQDVQRSISYYQDTHPEADLKRIIGIGSTFKLIGMRRLLSQQTKLEVYRLDHFKRLSVEGAGAAEFEAATLNMATAYGLALQGLSKETIRSNLMPTAVIRESLWKAKTPWFLTAAAIGVLAGGVTFIRPFLDNTAVTQSLADNSINNAVTTATRLGGDLKRDWQTTSQEKQPGFVAENLRRLVEASDTYQLITRDLSEVLGSSDGAATPGEPFRLVSFDTSYLAPGASLESPIVEGEGANRRPSARSGSSNQSGEETTAGSRGAVRVRLIVESTSAEPAVPYINETIISWLNENAERPGLPFTIRAIPAAEAVEVARAGGAAPATRGGRSASVGQRGGVAAPPARRGASTDRDELTPPPVADRSAGPLPPLPGTIKLNEPAPAQSRFTILYTYQLLETPVPEPDPDPDQASAQAPQGTAIAQGGTNR